MLASPGSPCIDTGIALSGVTPDLDGVARPLDSDGNGSVAPDLGAYEVVHAAADSDGDTLTDHDEITTHGTDPSLSDTDADGLDDAVEIQTHLTDPTRADTDGDGLLDGDEIQTHLTDPKDPDHDDDGLLDGDEINTYATDPKVVDSDDDGLDDGDEVHVYATNPNAADSDGDGLEDGDEVVVHETDPAAADTDGDDLDDGAEVGTHLTDPLEADTDGDTMSDGWELDYGFLPREQDGDADADNDFLSNAGESVAATHPHEPDTDGDSLTDGWEMTHGFDPLRAAESYPGVLDLVAEGVCATGGEAVDVAVTGNVACVVQSGGGLVTVDVSDPASPSVLGTMATVGTPCDVAVMNGGVVVAEGVDGLEVFDVSTPDAPVRVSGIDTILARYLDVVGDVAYCAGSEHFYAVDLSDAANPVAAHFTDACLEARGLDVDGDYAYAASALCDGLPDAWEIDWHGDLAQAATNDVDGDGLEEWAEWLISSGPRKLDTDNDNLTDGDEVWLHNTDPRDSDTDGEAFRLPASGTFPGPVVQNRTYLHSASVTPLVGTPSDTYCFAVTYYTPAGDAPVVSDVVVDGSITCGLTRVEGTVTNGVYACDRLLTNGFHSHAFVVSNAAGEVVTAPAEGTFAGPFVGTNLALVSHAGGHQPPFASWDDAATNLQAAIDLLGAEGGTVIVAPGVYRPWAEVMIDGPVTLYGLDGPWQTVIDGDGGHRCVYLDHTDAAVEGFALRNGYTAGDGGGVHIYRGGVLRRCILHDNVAEADGGGVYSRYDEVLENCFLAGNYAGNSGGGGYGHYGLTLINCTVSDNGAGVQAGGIDDATIRNSIVAYNSAPLYADCRSCSFSYSFTSDGSTGAGNLGGDPGLVCPSSPYLLPDSPCIDAGTNAYVVGRDIDGRSRVSGAYVDMGCHELGTGTAGGPALAVEIDAPYTTAVRGERVPFVARITGHATGYRWDWGDGTTGDIKAATPEHCFAVTGMVDVVLTASNSLGMASDTVRIRVLEACLTYVATNGRAVAPFTNWVDAATNIQQAIDASPGHVAGATILVGDGVFNRGYSMQEGARNRFALSGARVMRSLNGAAYTTVVGHGPHTNNPVRCGYVGGSAAVSGFTFSNGWTAADGHYFYEKSGGGLWCEEGARVDDCDFIDNHAAQYGGGIFYGAVARCRFVRNVAGTSGGGASGAVVRESWFEDNEAPTGGGARGCEMVNCALIANSASSGGGVYGGDLVNCTLIGNQADRGGGAFYGSFDNCIIYHNDAPQDPNWAFIGARYTCTTPAVSGGDGNRSDDPILASAVNPHVLAASPCRDAGDSTLASGLDIDGQPRITGAAVDIGCDEFSSIGMTGELTVSLTVPYTQAVAGAAMPFEGEVGGLASAFGWDWGDGQQSADSLQPWHVYDTPGAYQVVLTALNHDSVATTSLLVRVVDAYTAYVSPDGANQYPYTNWSDAAHVIQDAVDALPPICGAGVLVTNGTYSSGGRTVLGASRNRVVMTNVVHVRSVNGAAVTIIRGAGPAGSNAFRCAYLGRGAVLRGFTLADGHTADVTGLDPLYESGGGAVCESDSRIEDCVITGCRALSSGGGVYGPGVLRRCIVAHNDGGISGGGTDGAHLENCVVYSNQVTYHGSGCINGALDHCTVVRNTSRNGSGTDGGVGSSVVRSSVVWRNVNPYASGPSNCAGCVVSYTLTTAGIAGEGNLAGPPVFSDDAGHDYWLAAGSPGIDAGVDVGMRDDLDGIPRPLDGDGVSGPAPDMGAYEFVAAGADTDGDGLTDADELGVYATDPRWADTDGDGADDRHEFIAGTDALDERVYFCIHGRQGGAMGTTSRLVLEWNSVSGRLYTVYAAPNPVGVAGWSNVLELVGDGGTASYTNTVPAPRATLRVGVVRQAD